MKTLLALFLVVSFPKVPDLSYTGPHYCTKTDPDFKEFRYQNEVAVCERNVTSATKDKVYTSYKIPKEDRKEYTIDHFIPLALGGSNKQRNLWPQHISISSAKIEADTYRKLIKGQITHQEAVNIVLDFKLNMNHNKETK
jgi:hypothetical protein